MKKYHPAFVLFLVVMALICLCGVMLLIAGSRTYMPAPKPVPWLISQGMCHG